MADYIESEFITNCGEAYWALPAFIDCNLDPLPPDPDIPVCPSPIPSGFVECDDHTSIFYGTAPRHRDYCNPDGGPVHYPDDNPWWVQTGACDCFPGLSFLCACPGCSPHCPDGYTFDPASGQCAQGPWSCPDCPTGTVCDTGCEACVSTTPPQPCWVWDSDTCSWKNPADSPPCPGVLTGCVFSTDTCSWTCDPPPCTPYEGWDLASCACHTECAPTDCYCARSHRCINCHTPDCAVELNCAWDSAVCVWNCDPPSCAGGEAWEPSLCLCVPACPDGECWCAGSSTCVDCATRPLCFDALHCMWDATTCVYVCDNPDDVCAGRTWMGDPDCKCSGGGVFNLETPGGAFHVADDLSGGISYHRSDDTVPPFVSDVAVTTEAGDKSPRMTQGQDGRVVLNWVRAATGGLSDALETVSDDDGETWQEDATIFTGATQTTIQEDRRTGLIIRAGLISGEVWITRQYPGDASPSSEIAAQLYPGPVALALDDAGFHLSCASEGPGRWLLTGVSSGAVANFASADDGETWVSL